MSTLFNFSFILSRLAGTRLGITTLSAAFEAICIIVGETDIVIKTGRNITIPFLCDKNMWQPVPG